MRWKPNDFSLTFTARKNLTEDKTTKESPLSVINILLGITAIIGNTVILIALHKETSLHQPSKVLLRNLVASDSRQKLLCVTCNEMLDSLQFFRPYLKSRQLSKNIKKLTHYL